MVRSDEMIIPPIIVGGLVVDVDVVVVVVVVVVVAPGTE